MGRFYKTAEPQSLDYMYKLPENLLFKATEQASKDITDNQAALYSLYDKLKLAALSPDKKRAKEKMDYYESQINEMAKQIQENPLQFRRKGGEILGLATTMQKDFMRGEASGIGANYNVDIDWVKRTQERKDISDLNSVALMRNYNLQRFEDQGGTKFDEATGNYNIYSPEELLPTMNIGDRIAGYMKDVKANSRDITTEGLDATGRYQVRTQESNKEITGKELMDIALRNLYQDNELQDYIKQRSKIGALSGYYKTDKNGNMVRIDPFVETTDGKIVANPESAMYQLLAAKSDTYDTRDYKYSQTLSTDSYALHDASTAKGIPIDIKGDNVTYGNIPSDVTDATQLENYQRQLFDVTDIHESANDQFTSTLEGLLSNVSSDAKNNAFDRLNDAMKSSLNGDYSKLEKVAKDYGIDESYVSNYKRQIKERMIQATTFGNFSESVRNIAREAKNFNITDEELNKTVTENLALIKEGTVATALTKGVFIKNPADQNAVNTYTKSVATLLKNPNAWNLDSEIMIVDDARGTVKRTTMRQYKELEDGLKLYMKNSKGSSLYDQYGGNESEEPSEKIGSLDPDVSIINHEVGFGTNWNVSISLTGKDPKSTVRILVPQSTFKSATMNGDKGIVAKYNDYAEVNSRIVKQEAMYNALESFAKAQGIPNSDALKSFRGVIGFDSKGAAWYNPATKSITIQGEGAGVGPRDSQDLLESTFRMNK